MEESKSLIQSIRRSLFFLSRQMILSRREKRSDSSNIIRILVYKKRSSTESVEERLWSHQGLNLGPPDYESGATNQLSYRTKIYKWFGVGTEPLCKYNTFFDYFD